MRSTNFFMFDADCLGRRRGNVAHRFLGCLVWTNLDGLADEDFVLELEKLGFILGSAMIFGSVQVCDKQYCLCAFQQFCFDKGICSAFCKDNPE